MKYTLIDTLDKLKNLDNVLMDGSTPRFKTLAYDTETNGLTLHKSTVVGFSISYDRFSGFYVPLLKWVPNKESKKIRTVKGEKIESFMDGHLECVWTGKVYSEFVTPSEYNIQKNFPLIPKLLERWLKNSKIIMHNAPFDVNMTFINLGVDLSEPLFVDTALLLHAIDENEPTALKKAIERYREFLNINPHAIAAQEKKELERSILKNGGSSREVWRADLAEQYKYACADTFFTYGIYEAGMREFAENYGERGLNWFINEEVMPVCKEVVCEMKRNGVFIDVDYFKNLALENEQKLKQLEYSFLNDIKDLLKTFSLKKSIDEVVSHQALIKRILTKEGLNVPKTVNKKGEERESLSKSCVKKEYQKNPHWVWGYILGEDELKYTEEQLNSIKLEIYREKLGRDTEFNINSRDHLTWLFCDKLGISKTALPQTDSATASNPIPQINAETLSTVMLPRWSWVQTLLTYKKLYKLQSTYVLPAIELNQDGWLYMDFRQDGTTSGRFSCSGGLNLQTLPQADREDDALSSCSKCFSSNVKIVEQITCMSDLTCLDCGNKDKDILRASAIKAGFIAPPNKKIINSDFESLEPKCFAFASGEDKIKEVYRKKLDLYSKIYCDIFDTKKEYSADPKDPNFLKKVAKAKRTWVKPFALAIPYGADDDRVASLIGAKVPLMKNGRKILDQNGNPIMINDRKEGKRVRDAYLDSYAELKRYMERQENEATIVGYVETLVGRRRHLKFAKAVSDVLSQYDIDWRDLEKAKVRDLKRPTVSFTSQRGYAVTLTEAMLREIQELIGFKWENCQKGDYWAYIRGIFKNELNNAKNNPIQGLAGHIANRSMLEFKRECKNRKIEAHVCLQVHDEITVYCNQKDALEVKDILKNAMELNIYAQKIDVPMSAEPVICDNLKESK